MKEKKQENASALQQGTVLSELLFSSPLSLSIYLSIYSSVVSPPIPLLFFACPGDASAFDDDDDDEEFKTMSIRAVDQLRRSDITTGRSKRMLSNRGGACHCVFLMLLSRSCLFVRWLWFHIFLFIYFFIFLFFIFTLPSADREKMGSAGKMSQEQNQKLYEALEKIRKVLEVTELLTMKQKRMKKCSKFVYHSSSLLL